MVYNKSSPPAPVIIKKYVNRRLYDTSESRYITLDHLTRMVKEAHDFIVIDARTGADITRSVLMQIVFDAETGGSTPLLSAEFLRRLIMSYDDTMSGLVPAYLEASMTTLARNRHQVQHAVEASDTAGAPGHSETPEEEAERSSHHQLDALKRQLDLMQEEIDRLTVRKKD